MNPAILDMTCTLYSKGAEVGRKATWTTTVLPCHWEQRKGSYRTANGEDSAYDLQLICTYSGIAKGDKVAYGVVEATEPPTDAYTVVYVDALPFRGRFHHYEVYASV